MDTGGRAQQEQLPKHEEHEVFTLGFSSCSSCLRGELLCFCNLTTAYDKSFEFLLLRNSNGFSLADNALFAAESMAC